MTEQEKYLTWEDLAVFYKKKTGGTAKTKPMDTIYNWAIKQKEVVEDNEGLKWKRKNK